MTDTTGVCKTCSRPLPEGRTSGRCDPCRKQLANNVMRNGAKVVPLLAAAIVAVVSGGRMKWPRA